MCFVCILLVSRQAESAIDHGSMLNSGREHRLRGPLSQAGATRKPRCCADGADRNHVPTRTYPGVASLADLLRRTLRLHAPMV